MLGKLLPFLLLNPISISIPALFLDNSLTLGGDTLCQLPIKGAREINFLKPCMLKNVFILPSHLIDNESCWSLLICFLSKMGSRVRRGDGVEGFKKEEKV